MCTRHKCSSCHSSPHTLPPLSHTHAHTHTHTHTHTHPGSIDISDFYTFFEEKRSIFGDAIFELIDCNQSGSLTFGEFLHAVVTYCLFEQDEMLRFCFFIFDKDKVSVAP